MCRKIYLHLLILCGTFRQGIFSTLSDEDTGNSTESLVRKRRVINHLSTNGCPVQIENANFMVVIKENSVANCVGVILSHYTVLTAAQCVNQDNSNYKIFAGSAFNQNCYIHDITSKVENYGNVPHHRYEGISLLTVDPPFVFNRRTGNIQLYNGMLPVIGTRVTVFGWGCTYPPQPAPNGMRRKLRSITLPIMTSRECQSIYHDHVSHSSTQGTHNNIVITEKHLCTYDQHLYCARTDVGAPLIFHNRLAGIHVYKGEYAGGRNPDVYIDLQRGDYRDWILENTVLL